MFINYNTRNYVKSLVNDALASGSIGYLSGWAVKAVVPGIVNPINAAVYSISCFVLQKLAAGCPDNSGRARIIERTVCSIAAFGVCHFVGHPISVAAALALAGVSLIWNKVFSNSIS